MYKGETDQTILSVIRSYHQLGVWRIGDETTKARKLFYLFYYILYQVFNLMCIFCIDEKSEIMFLSSLGIFFVVITIKLIYLLWKKDEILGFVKDPVLCYSTECHNEWAQVSKKKKNFVKFIQTYLWMLRMTAFFMTFSCVPIFSSQKKLPLFIDYTLDCKFSEILYVFGYLFALTGIFCCLAFNLIMAVIWYVMFEYSTAYEMLGYRLKQLGSRTETSTRSYIEILIASIKAHQSIFK